MKNNNTISPKELKNLKKKVREQLSGARHEILIKYPFIGSIALRMDLIPIRDIRVRTACTDGKDVYFDISCDNSLNRDERVFVLAHEIWHAVLMHLVRKHTRAHNIFNIATDKEVNWMLKNDGLIPPEQVLMPDKNEEGLSAEEIYELLLKKQNFTKKTPGKNDGKSSDSTSNSSHQVSGQFDKHVYDGEEKEDPESYSPITDEYGEVGIDSDFRPYISKDFADKMR